MTRMSSALVISRFVVASESRDIETTAAQAVYRGALARPRTEALAPWRRLAGKEEDRHIRTDALDAYP